MSIALAKGVNLHVIPSKKFKTVSIKVKFSSPLQVETITKRSLLANLLDTNSQYYPTQTDFRKALSELYGARFGVGVGKKGNKHILTTYLSVVNDKYLSEAGVVEEAIDFLKSVLFHPHAFHKAFHKETFDRELQNLRDEFDARYDNKQAYASLAVKELYFDKEEHQIPSDGRPEDLEQCTPENVFETYEQMMAQDQIDIFVLGDVEESAIENAFKDFSFEDREVSALDIFYKKTDKEKKEKVDTQSVVQAKLNLAYETGIYYHQEGYYAGQVFNGIFGGYPHSKLFMNVREKESLAYYASSGLDTFRGAMFVQSGIDQKEAQRVEEIVNKQLIDIQNGAFRDEAMEQTKEMLKNSLHQSGDNASSIIELNYAMSNLDTPVSIEEWVQRIDAVTREEIVAVAKQVKQQATYLLKGDHE